jgi:probable F420-dependent oxidoreductase
MTVDVVARARRALGPAGATLPNIPFAPPVPFAEQRDAVRALEQAGWPAVWTNEGVGGKDVFVQLAMLLSATGRIAFGTGVANVWARPPETAHGAAASLAEAFPDRVVLGLGVGYPDQAATVGRAFDRPLETMRDYLERMPRPVAISPAPAAPFPRIVAASGPRMVALAAEAADGVLTVLVPAAHTARLRAQLGPDALLVVGLTAILDDDRARARAVATDFMATTVARPGSPYAANLVRLGYAQTDLEAGADHAVDDVLAHGRLDDVAAAVQRHLDAGADHVRVGAMAPDFAGGVAQQVRLAAVIGELRGR